MPKLSLARKSFGLSRVWEFQLELITRRTSWGQKSFSLISALFSKLRISYGHNINVWARNDIIQDSAWREIMPGHSVAWFSNWYLNLKISFFVLFFGKFPGSFRIPWHTNEFWIMDSIKLKKNQISTVDFPLLSKYCP